MITATILKIIRIIVLVFLPHVVLSTISLTKHLSREYDT